MSNHISTEHT